MSRNWTPKQQLAIETHGKTLLVSAAAGSGKTATLTERIVRALTDENSPSSIDKMLVVTFTRLSASDLKRKISEAISDEIKKNPTSLYLSKQLVLLESANICTIDSFYLDIVRSNFQRLSLPSNFRLADEGEMALLRKEVMDGIIEEHYDLSNDENDDFLSFVENFTSAKKSDTLSDIFLDLQNKLSSRTEGTDAALSLAEELGADAGREFFESRQGKIIHAYLLGAVRSYFDALTRCCDIIASSAEAQRAYFSAFAYEKTFLCELCEVLEKKSYSLAKEKMLSYNKQTLGKLSADCKTDEILMCVNLRNEESSFITKSRDKFFSFDEDGIKSSMEKTADILTSLHRILSEFEERALKEKIKRRAFGFDDIRYFAYRLLANEDGSPSDIALAYREQFDEIYIDEYQDVDAMQDKIFSLISRPDNRFMVGDIKQSIYNFRGADPDVFAGYKKAFPPIDSGTDGENALIFMSNNFRCDENVIKFTNKVFSFLFGNCPKSIEYTPEDDLIFSKSEPERTLPSPKVKIAVITDELGRNREKSDDGGDAINPEAIWIANEINRLIKYEKKADGTPIQPRDIAIIMRSTSPASDISRALGTLGIPCSDNSKYDLFETPDVLLALSLLSTVDNPHRDIPLTATLYSPVFAYTMDDLITIRTSADSSMSLFEALRNYEKCESADCSIVEKNRYFTEKLTHYRTLATSLPIDKLLNHIYKDLSLNSFEDPNRKNLTRLYEMARKFEAGSFKGLYNFIAYINELIENNKVPSLTYEDADANTVQMITAHKSKGLEFPVCFICNTQSRFNMEDTRLNMLYHQSAGIALKLAYAGGMAQLTTPMCEAVAQQIEDSQLEEEMRILYVALTRARERLYITGKSTSKLEKLDEKALLTNYFASDFEVRNCKNWLSMILSSIYPLESGDSYTFESYDKGEIEFDYAPSSLGECDSEEEYKAEPEYGANALKERFAYSYPHAHLSKLPAKLSISKLTPTVLDDMDSDAETLEAFDEAKILEIEEFFESKQKTTSAERGTATHLFLQFCDFENAEKNGAQAELERLTESKFISPEIAKLIDLTQIKKFFESKFYSDFKRADKIYRETRFNILLPASHFTKDEEFGADIEGEEILVQGVIDLFYTDSNGRIVLCDYKTDYLTPTELSDEGLVIKKMSERHGTQLRYYSMAIERLMGKAPEKTVIYSLPYGESVDIKL